jgi:large subunit ribosomal protein L1
MSKRYKKNLALVKLGKKYATDEAFEVLSKFEGAKFDETIDAAFALGVDTKQSDQQVRGSVLLPHGLGKKIVVAVICSEDKISEAKDAGADFVGADDLVEKINGGFTDFDVLVATPNMMAKVGKLGKVLGRKGLMPNPKAGTVVASGLGKAVQEFKTGKLEFKIDKFGIVHMPIGKISFSENHLAENFKSVYDAISRSKPTSVKGIFFKSVSLSPTMGPSVKVQTLN